MLKPSTKKTTQELIKEFLSEYRSDNGIYIPKNRLTDLLSILRDIGKISTDFGQNNPLSVMETMTVVLNFLGSNDDEISEIFDLSPSTIRSYMTRIKEKLDVSCKLDAITKSVRQGIIKMIY